MVTALKTKGDPYLSGVLHFSKIKMDSNRVDEH